MYIIRVRFTVVVLYMCVTTAAVCVCITMFVCMALTTGQGCQSRSWSAAGQGKCFIRRPRSRLIIWSRETGSADPSRVSLLIFILQAESDACLLTGFLPSSATASIHYWYTLCTINAAMHIYV